MVLSSGTKSDQRKLSEKVTSVKYKTANPEVKNNEDPKKPYKNGKKRDTQMSFKGICGVNCHANSISILRFYAVSESIWN